MRIARPITDDVQLLMTFDHWRLTTPFGHMGGRRCHIYDWCFTRQIELQHWTGFHKKCRFQIHWECFLIGSMTIAHVEQIKHKLLKIAFWFVNIQNCVNSFKISIHRLFSAAINNSLHRNFAPDMTTLVILILYIYFLLQRKNLPTYSKMLEILKYLLPSLVPQKVLINFEKACIGAVNITFPNAEVKGWYFHLCQSLIRKFNSVCLKIEFESNIEVKLKLKSLAALAFSEVRSVFDVLADSFPDEDKINEILMYFFSAYIEGAAGRDPQFSIRVWNHREAAVERSSKTTNCCEGFHNALNFIKCLILTGWAWKGSCMPQIQVEKSQTRTSRGKQEEMWSSTWPSWSHCTRLSRRASWTWFLRLICNNLCLLQGFM